MLPTKKFITQELNRLNEEQLKQVADFIALIEFRDRHLNLQAADLGLLIELCVIHRTPETEKIESILI
ncbi:MAG TPA: hypothetical protein V6D09_17595 [Leptolyngbyaceae cyanobacterium]